MDEDLIKMNDTSIQIIMKLKSENICYGLLTEDDVSVLLALNRLGIIKHLLFLYCDAVECYVHCIWS